MLCWFGIIFLFVLVILIDKSKNDIDYSIKYLVKNGYKIFKINDDSFVVNGSVYSAKELEDLASGKHGEKAREKFNYNRVYNMPEGRFLKGKQYGS